MAMLNTDTLSEKINHLLEQGRVVGEISIKSYFHDACLNRTFVVVVVDVIWCLKPTFHFTDYIRMEVKGSNGSFARINSSTTACYCDLDTKEVRYLHDVLQESYESFGVVSFRIPNHIVCNQGSQYLEIGSISLVVHMAASGLVDLSEISADYQHQAIKPDVEFSLIAAFAPNVGNNVISVIPTVTATPKIELRTMWRHIKRIELPKGCAKQGMKPEKETSD